MQGVMVFMAIVLRVSLEKESSAGSTWSGHPTRAAINLLFAGSQSRTSRKSAICHFAGRHNGTRVKSRCSVREWRGGEMVSQMRN